MKLEQWLDKTHEKITENRWMQFFTAFTRILLAVGFIPPSIPKILHKPFTVLPDSNPVGHYFNALYQTGFYYEFIGWTQILAAVLLLFPRTSHLGALMFLPIIANIAVLTTSVGFKGTWIVTIFMCLAATYLVAWEYDRLKPVLFAGRSGTSASVRFQFVTVPLFFAAGGAVMGGIWKLIGLGNFSNYLTITLALAGFGLVFGFLVAVHQRFMPSGPLRSQSVEPLK